MELSVASGHATGLQRDYGARALHTVTQPRFVLWFTGLSGSGKSTLANACARRFDELAVRSYVLDGDVLRHGLNEDLGFSDPDRHENIRRVAHLTAILMDAGVAVLTAFISPFRAERELARQRVGADAFVEVYLACPLETCERRDPKGLYRRARAGLIPEFTGIDSPYEPPLAPEIVLHTERMAVRECVDVVEHYLVGAGLIIRNTCDDDG
jgi:adenylylsulfate kinase